MADLNYTQIQKNDPRYNAFLGRKGTNYNLMVSYYGDEDKTNDIYLKGDDGTFTMIDPSKLTENPAVTTGRGRHRRSTPLWMSYNGTMLDPTKLYWGGPQSGAAGSSSLTPTSVTGAFRLNSTSAPKPAENLGAYSYNDWSSGNTPWGGLYEQLQSLSNIYGDIDTKDEFNVLGKLNMAQGLRDYVNNNYVNSKKEKKQLFNALGEFIGGDEDIASAAGLINQYLTSDLGKATREGLLRGQATLPMLNRYNAYSSFAGDDKDKQYLNQSLNSRDKMYRGAQFYRKYAGDLTWGNLANQFAENDYFRNDHYTVGEQHVMDRLNRDAGLGNGRKLIDVYNDIINTNRLDDKQAYDLFRDMTRRRFKMDNDFWNRHAAYLSGIRDQVHGADEVLFKKQGGQIFRMLFV